MFSRTTVTELSIKRESASARPPSTMLLIELPPSWSATRVASTDSGIEKQTASVARRLPRKVRIIRQVRNRPIPALVQERADRDDLDELRLVEDRLVHERLPGRRTAIFRRSRTPSTTAMVLESPPCLSTGR